MGTIQSGYRGLHLILVLNWDRFLYVLIVLFALSFGAFLGSL